MSLVTASHNPLRTRKLEQLPFRSPQDGSPFDWAGFVSSLQSAGRWPRGAIVGPHGSGKTTLLVELMHRLRSQGREVVMLFTNRDAGRRVPAHWLSALRATGTPALVLADGYDVLGPLSRWRLRRMLRPQGGLIVTAHRRCGLPTLLETRTSLGLLRSLVGELYGPPPLATLPANELLEGLYHSCHGNLREVFRRLYDAA